MFGIPLKTRQGWGYLYNDTITSKEDALEEINKIEAEMQSRFELPVDMFTG
jgi:hypothetical protein